MENPVRILGADGEPLPSKPTRASMLASGWGTDTPYDAANNFSSHMADWQPFLWSPDGEINMYRDRMVSRIRDIVRNDGWASGTVTRALDNIVGANFRPLFKPDYRALALYSGISAFDADWADEYGRAVEANYRTWALDPGRYCDTARMLTIPQQLRLGFRHKFADGDALGMVHWLPERIGEGRGRYATTLQIIDPDRLSNPQLRFDAQTMRGGVEIDPYGAPRAYWIRRAHSGDWFSAGKSMTWDRIDRETEWGRPIMIHDFDHDRAGQHRGVGVLTPVLQRLRMLAKYDSTELDAAVINAIFGAYVESPFDPQLVEQALGADTTQNEWNGYQQARADYHGKRKTSIGDARLPILFPGERINTVTAARPNSNFEPFEGAVLRNISAATGLSPQQISQNYADVNYSSMRAAMNEAWKTLEVRRHNYGTGFGQQIVTAWLEESFEFDDLPLPAGAPDYIECRAAYSRVQWMGPGRGYVDLVKERQGAVLGMDAGLSTLEREAAEGSGEDWEDNLDQRARELRAYKERDLAPPTWAGMQTANTTIQPPEAI